MRAAASNPALEVAPELLTQLEAHERKELLRLVVVGSVDDGKSTLIGRLLHETQALYEDQIAQVRRASKNGEEIDFSLFTDGLRAEREQGITIDVAYRYFSTACRKFIVADTPGHAQYTRNMATGASTAELALVLLDARLGILPQSRRHAYIASLLGIPSLLVAVNKMDLVGFDEGVFQKLVTEFQAFAANLTFARVTFVPVSARGGDNVVTRSPRMPWYGGETILEHLETVAPGRVDRAAPLRFPVQCVLRPDSSYRGFAGQLVSGSVRPGSEIVVLPGGKRTRVLAVDAFEGELQEAFAPLSVALRLSEEIDVSRGDLIASVESPPAVATQLEATLVWLGEQPLDASRAYLVKHTTRLVPARSLRVLWQLDLETLQPVPAQALCMNDIGRVALELKRPLMVEPYARQAAGGAFIVIDALTNATVAAGMVAALSTGSSAEAVEEGSSRVSARERRERLGHAAGVIAIRGDRPASLALARGLERTLFDGGLLPTIVERRDAAEACAAAGLLVLWVALPGEPTLEPMLSISAASLELPAATAVDEARRRILAAIDGESPPEGC